MRNSAHLEVHTLGNNVLVTPCFLLVSFSFNVLIIYKNVFFKVLTLRMLYAAFKTCITQILFCFLKMLTSVLMYNVFFNISSLII